MPDCVTANASIQFFFFYEFSIISSRHWQCVRIKTYQNHRKKEGPKRTYTLFIILLYVCLFNVRVPRVHGIGEITMQNKPKMVNLLLFIFVIRRIASGSVLAHTSEGALGRELYELGPCLSVQRQINTNYMQDKVPVLRN